MKDHVTLKTFRSLRDCIMKAEHGSSTNCSEEHQEQQSAINPDPTSAATGVQDVQEKACSAAAGENRRKGGYDFGEQDYNVWMRFRLAGLGEIRFNPVVTFGSLVLVVAFVASSLVLKEKAPFFAVTELIVKNFTWFYIGSMYCWAVFVIYLYFSKYADLKLGDPDDKPMFNNVTWFVMLFACGVGVGLFFYGVGEPILHYTGENRFSKDPFMPDNLLAQHSINITLIHWTLNSWVVYSLVGLLLAILNFREKLPMTIRSCFYPLIGDRIFGWIGDLIDIVSVISTLFGVCTSLGFGAKQINQGLASVFRNVPGESTLIQIVALWSVTTMATISTVSGIGMGVRRLSEVCFGVGIFLMVSVFCLDRTEYLSNLAVQSAGFYFQNLLSTDAHTDTFEQLGTAAEQAADRGRWLGPDGDFDASGPQDWIGSWTMFYWGWWIAWSPFVGMFIAKISRGKTIREFLNGTLTAPLLFSFFWVIVFGGSALRLERESADFGLCCKDPEGQWFVSHQNLSALVSQKNLINVTVMAPPEVTSSSSDEVTSSSSSWVCQQPGGCGSCASTVLRRAHEGGQSYGDLLDEYARFGRDKLGSISSDMQFNRLSCHLIEDMWFDVMLSYKDVGIFLSAFSLIGIALYFITSSDSGSIVIDCLTANGDPEPPAVQRVFWAVTEGVVATVLLLAGGTSGLAALQSAGLIAGLPFTFVICLICVSIWKSVKVGAGDLDPKGPTFDVNLLDCVGARPYKNASVTAPASNTGELKMSPPSTCKLIGQFLSNIVFAPITLARINIRLEQEDLNARRWSHFVLPVAIYLVTVTCFLMEIALKGCWAFGVFFYLAFACLMALARSQVREARSIEGNILEDLILSVAILPATLTQMQNTDIPLMSPEKDFSSSE